MRKKNLAFLLAASSDVLFAAANMALACNHYIHTKEYDIILYYDFLDKQTLNALNKIPHCILRQMYFPSNFAKNMLQRLPGYSRFASTNGLLAFCHFEVFSLLKKYKTVIWMDIDMHIQNDLDKLSQYAPLAMPNDGNFDIQINFTRPIRGYNMQKSGHCTSIIVAQDTIPYNNIYTWCWDTALQYAQFLYNADQGIINLLLDAFSITPVTLDRTIWNCNPSNSMAHQASIVHFGGPEKIWKNTHLQKVFPEWRKRHVQWLELGGTDYPPTAADAHVTAEVMENPPQQGDARLSVLCFGTGEMASSILKSLKQNHVRIAALIDDPPVARDMTLSAYPVITVEEIRTYSFDYILICCHPTSGVEEKLLAANVLPSKIVSMDLETELAENIDILLMKYKLPYQICLHEALWNYFEKFPRLQKCIEYNMLLYSPWLKKMRANNTKNIGEIK